MDMEKYKQFLLSVMPVAKSASGGREINCRCMYCADSKDPKKGHFYISIPQNEDEPSKFNCFKCSSSGWVTTQKLVEWGIYDPDIAVELNEHNKKVMKSPNYKSIKYNLVYNIRYNKISEDKLSLFKLQYINERLGTQLTYGDCIREKIVLNITDLLKVNPIKLTRSQYIVDFLDTSFIGFLSYDNAKLNMRNLDINKELPHSIDRRYINYNVIEKEDSTQSFYSIPNQVNVITMDPVNIHIAEGPFDILSIYHNLRKTLYQSLYISATGKGYKGVIRFCIMSLGIVNAVFHIYPDMDVEQYIIDDIAALLYPYRIPLYVHRNLYPNEKDFGVPLDRIQESVTRLL